jgi:hypothetical protein
MRKYLYALSVTGVLGLCAAYLMGVRIGPSIGAEVRAAHVHELHKAVDVKMLSAQAYDTF